MKTKSILLIALMLLISKSVFSQTAFKVDVKGKGAPVLLFPGFGCTGEVWNETVAELSKNYECHIFTFAGFGNVPPIEGPWLSTIKNQVVSYVKTKKLKKATLMGHSLGGTLSLWLAAEETNLFKKVIIVDALPASAALMIPNYKGEVIPYDNPQSKMMLGMDQKAFNAMNSQATSYMCLNKEKQKTVNEWMSVADRKTYVYGYIDMLNLDLRKEIAKIKIPVVILAATNPDLATVQNTYKAQYENLPSVKIYYAANSAHFVMYDQPEWFMEKVKSEIR
ncbi:alpha/beta fold hydrolase [Flavobacterium tructae]|uniref:Alpha/beta hydrolase n=1 Tax=Flavobacterium tructae TaxID=1114873 RepID=A0A1S1J815_9FLAO|nr:alpha/beta hydrolase [Flavobacterium tructae]OHT45940.1 alpha/beta hydrolase [Flavobacterium tructae]OXB21899.1 alpha/beta hydrolase [Flavobacterium tructae]